MLFGYVLPTTGHARDFYLLDFAHAGHTKKALLSITDNSAFSAKRGLCYAGCRSRCSQSSGRLLAELFCVRTTPAAEQRNNSYTTMTRQFTALVPCWPFE